MSTKIGRPLTPASTRRSLSCNHNKSARGRTDEGFQTGAFGHPFPASVSFAADPRVPGHRESQNAGTTASESAALVSPLRPIASVSKGAPSRGAFASVGQEEPINMKLVSPLEL